LARIETKVDMTLQQITKHDDRILRVERHVNKGLGLVAAVTLFFTVLGSWLWANVFGGRN
jgi:hypothetical protein